jgi:serine/threonine protein kinase
MLSGSYPYIGNNISELRAAIQESASTSFNSNLWPNISDEGKDLIKKLLVIEPKGRLTA